LSTFVWLSGLRWAVEQCCEEGKTELGMAHYEVRKYVGWHHQESGARQRAKTRRAEDRKSRGYQVGLCHA